MNQGQQKAGEPQGSGLRSVGFERLQLWLGAAILLVYVGISFKVGARFPFYHFPMYSAHQSEMSRVLARGADGGLAWPTDFERWHCPKWQDALADRDVCADAPHWRLDEMNGRGSLVRYMNANLEGQPAGPEAEPVALVALAYTAPDPMGPVVARECVILRCQAVPREARGDSGDIHGP